MTTSVLHALATGLPTITTNHGAFSEQIVNNKNGFMVPEGDYEALAERIIYMMEHPEIWADFGKFGRKHVDVNFNLGQIIEKQVQLYKEILDK